MRKIILYAFVFFVSIGNTGKTADSPVPFTVQEKWVYEHTGPRPWSDGKDSIDENHVLEVISVEGVNGIKRWAVKETWGTDERDNSILYYDSEKQLHKQEVGQNFVICFNPPIPDHSTMDIGEEKTVEINAIMGNEGRGQHNPLIIQAKRLENEMVTVPAGQFEDCIHVETEETITFETENGNVDLVLKQSFWYHSEANGIVKQHWQFSPVQFGDNIRTAYSCTSELIEHTLPEKE